MKKLFYVRYYLLLPNEMNLYSVFGTRQHEICGLIGFHFSDFDNHRTELGYWLLPEYQHRGIITESVRKLCPWAVQEKKIKRIQIRCAVGNAASNAVPFASVSSMKEQNVAENCWLRENIQIYIYTAS